jgi:hypothetical protein
VEGAARSAARKRMASKQRASLNSKCALQQHVCEIILHETRSQSSALQRNQIARMRGHDRSAHVKVCLTKDNFENEDRDLRSVRA